jgi:hypothetical protein
LSVIKSGVELRLTAKGIIFSCARNSGEAREGLSVNN